MGEVKESGPIKQVIKGILTAVIVALIGILVLAFVAKIAMLNNGVIKAVNQFIKILSVFLGVSTCIRKSVGLVKGAVVGLIFTLIVYLTFCLIGSNISFGFAFILELIFMAIIGGISGMIAVNMKK